MVNNPRLPAETIAYIEDMVGADINRDLLKVAIAGQDIGTVEVDASAGNPVNVTLDDVKGVPQTGADWTKLFQTIAEIQKALNSEGTDQLRVESPSPLDVSASEVDVDINSQSAGDVTTNLEQVGGTALSGVDIAAAISTLANAAKSNDTDELVVRVTDSGGVEVNPLTDDVTRSVGADTLRVTEVNPLSQQYSVPDINVGNGGIWEIPSNVTEEVNDAMVYGTLIVDGTLKVYGTLTGSGRIIGEGEIRHITI